MPAARLSTAHWRSRQLNSLQPLVTVSAAGVGERLACLGHKLSVVARAAQRQLEDAERIGVADVAVGLDGAEPAEARPAGADDEFADAGHRVRVAVPILGSKPLIVVVVAAQDNLRADIIESLPDRLHGRGVAVVAGAKPRMMPVGRGAGRRVSAEVGAQPLLLR